MSESAIAAYIAENPKKAGVLFTILLLLTQASNASAGFVTAVGGP
ncbi:DUF7503 family protein [Salinirubrum litoreum]|uniref:Uncharacterized protein n=1 Tax=Salinirubrum litoreum TaxID=1126234 RepID=A0ABD5RAQ6_9EURY|nr:hypothetical protein [Salinirubrum litoreum]